MPRGEDGIYCTMCAPATPRRPRTVPALQCGLSGASSQKAQQAGVIRQPLNLNVKNQLVIFHGYRGSLSLPLC